MHCKILYNYTLFEPHHSIKYYTINPLEKKQREKRCTLIRTYNPDVKK